MLVSPVESSWQILKELLLKAARGEPPDKDEKDLIRRLSNCDARDARHILSKYRTDDHKFIRLYEILQKYTPKWELASKTGIECPTCEKEGEEGRHCEQCGSSSGRGRINQDEPIVSAVGEDGSSVFSPKAWNSILHEHSKMGDNHYKNYVFPNRYETSKNALALMAHKDKKVHALWNLRCLELAKQHPDEHDESKSAILKTLDSRIERMNQTPRTKNAIRAMMRGKDESERAKVEDTIHNSNRLQVLKGYYKDNACADVLLAMQGHQEHIDDCELGKGASSCDCPSILQSKGSLRQSREEKMGSRHDINSYGNLVDQERTNLAIMSLGKILRDAPQNPKMKKGKLDSRYHRIVNWWEDQPWEVRRIILGCRIDFGSGPETLLKVLFATWRLPAEERDDIFHAISDFEGDKAKEAARGQKHAIETNSIIGDWGSRDLFKYLNHDPRPQHAAGGGDAPDEFDSLEGSGAGAQASTGGEGTYEGEPEKPQHVKDRGGRDLLEDEDYFEAGGDSPLDPNEMAGVERDRVSSGIPFNTYDMRYDDEDWERAYREFEKELQGRVDDSIGDGPYAHESHPLHLTEKDMEILLDNHAMVEHLTTRATPQAQQRMLKDAESELSKEREKVHHRFDERAHESGISPTLLEFAIRELAFLKTKEGSRFLMLKKALYNKHDIENTPSVILSSDAGTMARHMLLGTQRTYGKDPITGERPVDVSMVECPKCKGSKEYTKNSRAKRPIPCNRCDASGEVPGISETTLSDSQKHKIVEDLKKEYDVLKNVHDRNIIQLARDNDFYEPCTECIDEETGKPTGIDPYLNEECFICDGNKEFVNPSGFLHKILAKIDFEGFTATDALEAMAKELEGAHSTLRFAQRKEQRDREIANFSNRGILPDGVHFLLHHNGLHTEELGSDGITRGGVLTNRNLMDLRRKVMLENKGAPITHIRDEIAKSLVEDFKLIDNNLGVPGFFLRDAVHSSWFNKLCEILSYDPHLPNHPEAINQRISNHLETVRHPGRFDSRPAIAPCGVCHGSRQARESGTGNYLEGHPCPACRKKVDLGGGVYGHESTGVQRYGGNKVISAVTNNSLMRDMKPSCACCGDGHNRRIVAGVGPKSRIYHNPMDINRLTLAVLDKYKELHEDIKMKSDAYTEDPSPELKQQIQQLDMAMKDLIEREGEEFQSVFDGETHQQALEKYKRGEKAIEQFDTIASAMQDDEDALPSNTECPFCKVEAMMGRPPMPGSNSLDIPNLGDKDGYHQGPNMMSSGEGCPNDPQSEDGTKIFESMIHRAIMDKDMYALQEASWARGPLLDELQDTHEEIGLVTPEQREEWREQGKDIGEEYEKLRINKRQEFTHSPLYKQHRGDLDFGKFAAMRRRGGKPTPDEQFTHKFHSRYYNTNSDRQALHGTTETDRENYSYGERHLDRIHDDGILDPEHDELLKELYAIHILTPDYLVHAHGNPLWLTGGEDEKGMQDWARKTLDMDKGEKVNDAHKRLLKNNLHLLSPLLVAEKEWSHYYLAPREEQIEKGWPESIFNTTDSKAPFLKPQTLERVFGELRGHYRDCEEALRYGYVSQDHHGFMPTTNHFPDMTLFLNNPNIPAWIGKAWIAHDEGLSDPDHDFYKKSNGLFATKGRTLEEMKPIADYIWCALRGEPLGTDEFPLTLEDLKEGYGELDYRGPAPMKGEPKSSGVNAADEDAWFRVRDMLMRRSSDPEGSAKALKAILPHRDRVTGLNPWGYATSCTACDGMGHISPEDFIKKSPAFIQFRTTDGERSWLALDAEGRPIMRSGEIEYGDPRVIQFFKEHARTHTHSEWEDHPNFDPEDPTWFTREGVSMQCPGCNGTHVCPGCDGNTGTPIPEHVREKLWTALNWLSQQGRELLGKTIKYPMDPSGPTELVVDPSKAVINKLPDDVLDESGYIPPRTHLPGATKQIPGVLWYEEKDDKGEPTGVIYTIRDPWYSHTGGMGTGTSFNRQLEKVPADEFWGAGNIGPPPQEGWGLPAGSEAQDRKLEDLKESMTFKPEPPLLGERKKPEPTEWVGGEKPKMGQCQYPGCEQIIPEAESYCGPTELYEHASTVGQGKKMLELRHSNNPAPDHKSLMASPRMQEAMNTEIPSKQYYGGHEAIRNMIELGFSMVSSKAYGTVLHLDPEKFKSDVADGFQMWMDHFRDSDLEDVGGSKWAQIKRLESEYKQGGITREEFDKKKEKVEDEHFEALQDATSEWLNGFEKLDMHIPYFTHPDLVDDDGNEIPHSPFDVFHSGSIPNDISTFNYIEHGFDHTNPQERNRVKFGDTTLFLSGVKPVSVCPRCFMKLSRDDVDNGECPHCHDSFSEPNQDYIYPGKGFGGHLNTDGINWIAPALDNRDSLKSRAQYMATLTPGAYEGGLRDPALVSCGMCGGRGWFRDKQNNKHSCQHCAEIPGMGHVALGEHISGGVTSNEWDKYAIVQYHRPNYQITSGFAGDEASFSPVKGDEMQQVIDALRLAAGGSQISDTLFMPDVNRRLTGKELRGVHDVVNDKAATKAEHELKALLDPNTVIPTLNSGFFSGNGWSHPKFNKAYFTGYRSAEKKVRRLSSLLAGSSSGVGTSDLFRITGATSFSDLGKPSAAENIGGLPGWTKSALLKRKIGQAKGHITKYEDKKKLSDYEQGKLNDARLLLGLTEQFTEQGHPIALLNKMQTGTKIYRLEIADHSKPGIVRDVPMTLLHGAFLSRGGKTSQQMASEMLENNFGTDHNIYHVNGGVMGTAGSIFTDRMDALDKRTEGHFRYGAKPRPPEEDGTVREGLETTDRVERDAVFTPAALIEERNRVHGLGRHDHAEAYHSRLESALEGTNIKVPPLPPPVERGTLSTEEAGRLTGDTLPEPPKYPTEGPEGPMQWTRSDDDEPMSLAWDKILKNIKIVQ